MRNSAQRHRLASEPKELEGGVVPEGHYLRVDNTNLPAAAVALMIKESFGFIKQDEPLRNESTA
ncbi:MAG: hypothetical protein LBG83_02925 [Oscillospiraceae bacterium]|nr:hypothetical protein [Oscillospiraceae bacterium]